MTGVYCKTMTMTDNGIHALESSPKKLKYAYITVTVQNMKFGNQVTQDYPIAAGASIPMTDLDISKLYFKNAAAGANGTVTVIGTL